MASWQSDACTAGLETELARIGTASKDGTSDETEREEDSVPPHLADTWLKE
jgi:hypothetical protein